MTVTIRRSVLIRRPAAEVFAYISDFSHAKEWRVEVRESRQTPPGPMARGSQLYEEAIIMGRSVVTEATVQEFEPGHCWRFQHTAGPIPVGGEYLVEPAADGSRMTYTLYPRLQGVWALLAPYLKRSTSKGMAASLERLRVRMES